MMGESNGVFAFAEVMTPGGYPLDQVASALQKTIRRGKTEEAMYWAMELYPKFHKYLWKRLLVVAVEDIDDPNVIVQVKAMHDSFLFTNEDALKPKSQKKIRHRIFISKAVMTLCDADKNRESDHVQMWIDKVRKGKPRKIPEYAKDVHTKEGRQNGSKKADFLLEEQKALVPKPSIAADYYFKKVTNG